MRNGAARETSQYWGVAVGVALVVAVVLLVFVLG